MAIHVTAVGDICVGGPLRDSDRGSGTLWSLLSDCDLALGNLESTLTTRGPRADKLITLRADPSMAEQIRRLGIRAVTCATNHTMDYGAEGMYDTLDALDQAGIARCGAGRNIDEAGRAASIEAAGLSLALLSYACTVPPGFSATEDRPGVAPIRVTTQYVLDSVLNDEQPGSAPYIATTVLESDLDIAASYVERARAEHDFVIVGLHWGVMPLWMPPIQGALADYQQPLARRLIEAGADLVLGGHPHVPHGVEVYQGKLIVYSLGNFIFHRLPGSDPDTRRPGPALSTGGASHLLDFQGFALRSGVMLHATVGRHALEQAELIPYRLDERKEPCPVRGSEAREVLQLVWASSPNPDHFAVDGDVGRVPSSLFR